MVPMETDSITCAVAECDNLVESRRVCGHHLRRIISGNVTYDVDLGTVVDHCNEGHALVGDNVRWESSGRKGKRRRRCRACLRLRAQRQSRDAGGLADPPSPYRPEDLVLTNAIDEFSHALTLLDAKCKGAPSLYMDWVSPPSATEAKAMCAGCPFLQACANYAVAAQEQHGVWGGEVIHDGVKLT